jgi:formylglycine-generating enzyme required for sulfatase activity
LTKLRFEQGGDGPTFGEADFPLAVGLTDRGVEIGPSAAGRTVAWLLQHPKGLSLQPEDSGIRFLVNGVPPSRAVWISDGDRIQIDQHFLVVDWTGDMPCLRIVDQKPAPSSDPPVEVAASEQAQRIGRKFDDSGRTQSGKAGRRVGIFAVASAFAALCAGMAFVLLASPINLRFTPDADTVSIAGFPPPFQVGDRHLALPGKYRVEARKEGFKDIDRSIVVEYGAAPLHDLAFQKLDGVVRVTTKPIDGAKVLVDGIERASTPAEIEVEAGARDIKVTADRYLPESRQMAVEGMGRRQDLEIELKPAWAEIRISSRPAGAQVKIGDGVIGSTPVLAEVLQGEHDLEISLSGWKAIRRKLIVKAGVPETLPAFELERLDGVLALVSEPTGATVTVNGQFRGQTPLSIPLVGERDYQVVLSKSGYENETRSLRIEGEKTNRSSIQLQPEYGTVFVTMSPPGATLKVNGKTSGTGSQRLSLQTLPQTLEIDMPGHESQKVAVTPQKGVAKRIDITLKTVGQAMRDKYGRGIVTAGGEKMVFAQITEPVVIMIGSPRRDPSRRSNETEYQVELTRSFLISEKEVTNADFKKFKPGHSSGSIQGTSLDGADQPVVNVSWEDAARYANWLSSKEGLAPAYREQGGKVVAVNPLTNGYRLPTEAEWEFVARYEAVARTGAQPLRFPWGDTATAPAGSGNFAHEGSGLPLTIPGYVDQHIGSAPVGKFPPNRAQIYDLAGNVAEWGHDYYDVVLGTSAGIKRDPAGPAEGRFHVVKGSSWRTGSLAELRYAYRDYTEKPRDDLGFRVARYVEAP